MTSAGIILLIVAAGIIAVLAWYQVQQRRSRRLRLRFGPEYDHTLREFGNSRPKAEANLARREERVEKMHVHSLTRDRQERFVGEWQHVQARFVDDPPGSIREADRLVCEVMQARGYPMSDFERRAEDLSVDHPRVVLNYCAAHEVAAQQEKGQASTEDLRRALVYYRELFDELLEAHPAGHRETKR
jgi:hypothetical protein